MSDAPGSPQQPAAAPKKRRPLLWIGIAIVVALVLFVGGPFLYLNVIKEDAPAPLALTTTTTEAGQAAPPTSGGGGGTGEVEGTWTIGEGSEAGYRVEETLFGQSAEGVGRTSDIEGSITIAGTDVTEGSFTVDMTTVTSDSNQRDGQFNGRIMDTDNFPTATFELTAPIELGAIPADGEVVTAEATGDLTLKGVTKSVTFEVEAQLSSGAINITGSIPVTFDDYGVDNPSGGPAQVGDTGTLEFLLVLTSA